ncbi:hypothetical protein K2173_019256 [Erythroxylum novogranatense]|uniref:Uncharacterized protein n=1 Tax=Erythroxylum novogranatense TaxID=1862640 RepID=A0AAV8ST98_9ROSI|nr:hypothetical protein K2173_019256 [Erythroxylum novogranatense]
MVSPSNSTLCLNGELRSTSTVRNLQTLTGCLVYWNRMVIPNIFLTYSLTRREDAAQLHQFIIHAALDVVQDLAWTTSAIYILFFRLFLKGIDRFNDMVVSVYDGIKRFFQEVHELHIKILLNPLYLLGSRITSSHVDTKIRSLARKYI